MKTTYKKNGEKVIEWIDGGEKIQFVVPQKGRHFLFYDEAGREVREYDNVVDENGVEYVAYFETVVSLDEKHIYGDYEWKDHKFWLKEAVA